MTSQSGAVAPELVACIAGGRAPTIQELARMADRIARELSGSHSRLRLASGAGDRSVRLIRYRVAQASLVGDLNIAPVPPRRLGRQPADGELTA